MARRAVTEETTGDTPSLRLTGVTLAPPSWGGRFAGPFASVRLAVVSLRRTIGLLLVVSLGMLAAIALICTVPLYTRLVSQVQLQQTLAAQQPSAVNVEVSAQAVAILPGVAESIVKQNDSLVHRWIGDFTAGSTSFRATASCISPRSIASINGCGPVSRPPLCRMTPRRLCTASI
jgi:hypothetical protein